MSLLYDDNDHDDLSLPSFGVNKDFAEKYETKKRTEELSKLQDKYGKDHTLSDEEDSEELSDDDSDGEFVTPAVDVAILRTLARIRTKDPAVYEEGREIFDEEESRTAAPLASTSAKAKDSKPVLLKDYQRARMLADPAAEGSDEVSAAGFARTFAQESLDLKSEVTRAFAAAGSDSDDDMDQLLVRREKTQDERERDDAEYEKFMKAHAGDREVEDALEQEEKFLRDFILNRGWIDRSGNKSRIPSYNEITRASPEPDAKKKAKAAKKAAAAVAAAASDGEDAAIPDPGAHDDEDEAFDDVAEEFEHKYNFRFEEDGAAALQTHARGLASSVRKPTAAVSARAKQREAARQREEEQKRERKEEIRRLKALKRKEVEAKLLQIVEAGGQGAAGLDSLDIEGDWDPEEHDRRMAAAYGGAYEGAADDDFKPTWDDDIDIGDIVGSDDDEGGAGGAHGGAADEGEEDNDDDEAGTSTKALSKREKSRDKKKKQQSAKAEGFPSDLLERAKEGADDARKQLLDQMVDDYYALDYEDKVGGVPTRFHYARVAPASFSLSAQEILLATDTELNAFLSLRKLAPYRQDDGSGKAGKQKKRLKELRDALKTRRWGEEVDEAQAERDASRKRKYKEEGGMKREKKEGGEGEAGAKKLGKSERKRRKMEKAAAEAAAGAAAE